MTQQTLINVDASAAPTPTQVTRRVCLQKLLVTIDSSQSERVREYQRRCEEALTDVLLKGAAPPVRLSHQYSFLSLCLYSHHAVLLRGAAPPVTRLKHTLKLPQLLELHMELQLCALCKFVFSSKLATCPASSRVLRMNESSRHDSCSVVHVCVT